MLKLDFSIVTSEERAEFVSNFFGANPDYKPTQNELDTLSNYILYGKDQADGQSVVDRKEVEIDTKYKSYAKRKAESLDGLLETPGFNENTIVTKYIYRKPKPTIDREADASVPGMRELWGTIDRLAYVLDVCEGRGELDPQQRPIPEYSTTDLYKLKHYLIELRKQQYVLKESARETEHLFNPNVHKAGGAPEHDNPIDWDQFWFYPLGLCTLPNDGRFAAPEQYEHRVSPWDRYQHLDDLVHRQVIDFTNPEHIYLLCKNYQDLTIAAEQDGESVSDGIVKTLEFYVKCAALAEPKSTIWQLKCAQWSNEAIRQVVNEQFGMHYNENYISTVFKKNVCTEIAAAARLHADYFLNRADDSAWKVCSYCGKRKLRDLREFMKKSKSSDGLAPRCKVCEKEARARSKAATVK